MRNTLVIPSRKVRRAIQIVVCVTLALPVLFYQSRSVAYQDVASALGHKADNRWMVHIERPAGESVAAISLTGKDEGSVDPVVTSSLSRSAEIKETIKSSPLPETINKRIKGDRVVQTTAKGAPKDFSAGSVLQRQSVLEPLDSGKKLALEFVKPKPMDEAFEVASSFHPRNPGIKPAEELPTVVASLVKQSASSVLAYTQEPEVIYSPFSAVLTEEQTVKILPKLNEGDHAWADDPLPLNSFSEAQQRCLAQGIYFEARGEPVKGQAAVSQVILNRVRNPHYPNTICGVVYQNKHWRNRCQFSFACDRIRDRVRNKRLYEIAQHVAAETTAGRIWLSQVGSSTHYHATYVNPRWNRRMKRVGRIGLHIFYRTFGGGWS